MERVKCDNGCLDDVEVEDNCACSKVQQPPPFPRNKYHFNEFTLKPL